MGKWPDPALVGYRRLIRLLCQSHTCRLNLRPGKARPYGSTLARSPTDGTIGIISHTTLECASIIGLSEWFGAKARNVAAADTTWPALQRFDAQRYANSAASFPPQFSR